MNNEWAVSKIKGLIEDFEIQSKRLDDMVTIWNTSEDPSCDPALQYEQEVVVETCWNKLSDFCKETFK